MSDFLSNDWIQQLATAWNADPTIVDSLAKASFTSIVAYGILNEDKPRCYIAIENGVIVYAGLYTQQKLDWDLRASLEHWQHWLEEGFGLGNMGPAVALGRLKFIKGDYRGMIRNPKLAVPFLHHFDLMSEIPTEFNSKVKKSKGFSGIFDFFKK